MFIGSFAPANFRRVINSTIFRITNRSKIDPPSNLIPTSKHKDGKTGILRFSELPLGPQDNCSYCNQEKRSSRWFFGRLSVSYCTETHVVLYLYNVILNWKIIAFGLTETIRITNMLMTYLKTVKKTVVL